MRNMVTYNPPLPCSAALLMPWPDTSRVDRRSGRRDREKMRIDIIDRAAKRRGVILQNIEPTRHGPTASRTLLPRAPTISISARLNPDVSIQARDTHQHMSLPRRRTRISFATLPARRPPPNIASPAHESLSRAGWIRCRSHVQIENRFTSGFGRAGIVVDNIPNLAGSAARTGA